MKKVHPLVALTETQIHYYWQMPGVWMGVGTHKDITDGAFMIVFGSVETWWPLASRGSRILKLCTYFKHIFWSNHTQQRLFPRRQLVH